jgi:hypothetical protein
MGMFTDALKDGLRGGEKLKLRDVEITSALSDPRMVQSLFSGKLNRFGRIVTGAPVVRSMRQSVTRTQGALQRQSRQVLDSTVMAKDVSTFDLRRYALLGAEARLREIETELSAIRKAFPELREGGRLVEGSPMTGRSAGDQPHRPRSRMSAAQRKAVSERMKKYWAARRGKEGNGGQPTTTSGKPTAVRTASKRRPRKMSAAARKRISDAQKKRWAKLRKTA